MPGARSSRQSADSSKHASASRFRSGTYETLRATNLFDGPSPSAHIVAGIERGVRINVVASSGDWLEVRSRHGNPPGFIRKDDARSVNEPTHNLTAYCFIRSASFVNDKPSRAATIPVNFSSPRRARYNAIEPRDLATEAVLAKVRLHVRAGVLG